MNAPTPKPAVTGLPSPEDAARMLAGGAAVPGPKPQPEPSRAPERADAMGPANYSKRALRDAPQSVEAKAQKAGARAAGAVDGWLPLMSGGLVLLDHTCSRPGSAWMALSWRAAISRIFRVLAAILDFGRRTR
mgnify:CR=1 FL=1